MLPAAASTPRTNLSVIGGFAGTGKTYHSQRLSTELSIPRLSFDAIGQTISASRFFDTSSNAIALAYDVVFGLCNDFLRYGVSAVLDLNMAWEFQWQHLDALRDQHPYVRCVAIILRAPWDVCLERIRRHEANPNTSAPPEVFATTQHILDGWAFLERLDRPDIKVIDADRSETAVYEDIQHHVRQAMTSSVSR